MSIAEIIDVGDGQAVKLPAEFRFAGDVVSIRREGKAVILEPVEADVPVAAWPDGFFESIRIDDPKFTRPDQGAMPPIASLD